jgi:hypothetical protein
MGTSRSKGKEELLQIAADATASKRPRAGLEAHGITLGDPIVGEEAKRMLLEQLDTEETQERELAEQVSAAEGLWKNARRAGRPGSHQARVRVAVITRPIVLGLEPVQELAKLMVGRGHEHSCQFTGLKLAIPRPRWKFW